MEIDWWTIVLQALNFLILVWLLQRFLYKPVRRIIDARQAETEDAFAAAAAQKEEAARAESDYHDKVAALADERRVMIQEARTQIDEERTETVREAKQEAAEVIEEARRAVKAERAEALGALRDQAAGMAAEMAAATLDGSQSPAVTQRFVEALRARIAELSGDDLSALGVGGAGGWRVRVLSAHPLDETARTRFGETAAEKLGPEVEPAFAVDETLIAGARVVFPAAVMRLSWRDHLDGVRGLVVEARDPMKGGGGDQAAD